MIFIIFFKISSARGLLRGGLVCVKAYLLR